MLLSCISTGVTKLDTTYNYRPTSAKEVKVYLEPEDVPCNFERIALINTKTAFKMNDLRSINLAKMEAASAGGNAIILRGFRYPEAENDTAKVGTKVAIFITDTGCN